MSQSPRQMKLLTGIANVNHPAGWRHPDAYDGDPFDFRKFAAMAQLAERGKFDALFFADNVGYSTIAGKDAFCRIHTGKYDPTVIASALAVVTERIGFVVSGTTTFSDPYGLARRFASLDRLSHGRVGWNIVTSTSENEAHNHSLERLPDHDSRYARAEEFVEVVCGLWDTWERDAVGVDKVSGHYFDPDKVQALNHKGEHFSVAGPLNVPPLFRGRPVLVQAGGSPVGRRFAARTAEIAFTGGGSIEAAKAYRSEVLALAAGYGRGPGEMLFAQGFMPIIGDTEDDAKARHAELEALVDPVLALSMLQTTMGGVDLSPYPFDGPLPEDLEPPNGTQSGFLAIQRVAREEGLSIRQLSQRYGPSRGGLVVVGTARHVAETMEAWFTQGAADGFIVGSPYYPQGLESFVDNVIPILQEKGLFRTEYEGETLRENLGFQEPPNRFVANPALRAEPEIWRPAHRGPGPARL